MPIWQTTEGEGSSGPIFADTIFEIECTPKGYDCIEIHCIDDPHEPPKWVCSTNPDDYYHCSN